jgi:hypothetical protein
MRQLEAMRQIGGHLFGPMLAGIRPRVLEEPALAIGMTEPELRLTAELLVALPLYCDRKLDYSPRCHVRNDAANDDKGPVLEKMPLLDRDRQ